MKLGRLLSVALLSAALAGVPAAAQAQRSQDDSRTRAGQQSQRGDQSQQAQQRRRAAVQGEVVETRKVRVRNLGTDHLVVLVQMDSGKLAAVDLGPLENLRQVKVAAGDTLYAAGDVVAVGDRAVLMARNVRADGQDLAIDRRPRQQTQRVARQALDRVTQRERDREAQTTMRRRGDDDAQHRVQRGHIMGTIVRTKTIDVRATGDKQLVALLETDRGARVPVDLGPLEGLQQVQIERGDNVTIYGALRTLGDYQAVIAEQIRVDGQQVTIRQRPMQQLSGQIVALKTVQLPGVDQRALVARFETTEGRTLFAALGGTEQMRRARLQEGDQVELLGRVVPIHGRSFLIAQQIRTDGRTIRPQQQGRPDTGRDMQRDRRANQPYPG